MTDDNNSSTVSSDVHLDLIILLNVLVWVEGQTFPVKIYSYIHQACKLGYIHIQLIWNIIRYM